MPIESFPQDEIKTKPCPFCYSTDWDEAVRAGVVFIECQVCNSRGPGAGNLFNATRLWNLRP